METAKGIVDAASKMVFGDNQDQTQNETGGVEPQSGQTGDGTADKPYDAGNSAGQSTDTSSFATGTSDMGTTTTATSNTADPANTEGSREPKTAATSSAGPDVGAAAPESGAQPQQKQQGADRPHEAPEGEQAEAVSNKKQEAENAMSQDAGDGPKPLDGGNQGESKGESGQKDQLGSTSKEPGTGTKYEKSTGLAAEGGDFDAKRPGAAREADRILEEKGIHHDGGNQGPPQEVPGATSGDSSSDKPSMGQKIKDKLHIGKKS